MKLAARIALVVAAVPAVIALLPSLFWLLLIKRVDDWLG